MQSMRPRFELVVPFGPDEVHRRLEARLACAGCPCQADVMGRHVEVQIRDRLRHFWSPRLSLEIEEHAQGAVLNGLYGPNPNVWTMFMAAYAFLFFCALFGGVFGFVQVSLGMGTWGLWVGGVSVGLCVLPYLGSLQGQRWASDQMELLRCFLEESLSLAHTPVRHATCPPPEPKAAGRKLPMAR